MTSHVFHNGNMWAATNGMVTNDQSRGDASSMDSLMDSSTGAYRVATAASTYWIDLDRMVLRRDPRTEDVDGSLLRRDAELITLLQVVDCTVGRPMELRVDLHVAGVAFTTRCSTSVVSIERITSPGEQRDGRP